LSAEAACTKTRLWAPRRSSARRAPQRVAQASERIRENRGRLAHRRQGSLFLQTDPVGYDAGPNLYEYVEDDPTDKTDPTGDCPECVSAIVGAAVGAGLEVATETLVEHRDFQHLDGGAIAREAIIGGVAGATGAGAARLVGKAVGITTVAAKVAASAANGAVSAGVSSAAHGDKVGGIVAKTVAGGVLGGVGQKVASTVTSKLGAAPAAAGGQIVTWGASKSQTATASAAGVIASKAITSGGNHEVSAGCKAANECK